MNQDDFIDILKEATENWYKHQNQNNILQAEQFFDEYEKVKDMLWNPEMPDFLKDHSFTKSMVYAHYLQVHYERGFDKPHLRLVN